LSTFGDTFSTPILLQLLSVTKMLGVGGYSIWRWRRSCERKTVRDLGFENCIQTRFMSSVKMAGAFERLILFNSVIAAMKRN